MPSGTFPIVYITGEEGVAKTAATEAIRRSIDPNHAVTKSVSKSEHDFIIGASNQHIIALDNISTAPYWLSDALCRLSTGSGFATKELYTDIEESIFFARKPSIVNGINTIFTRADILSRMLIVTLEKIKKEDRIPQEKLNKLFIKKRALILGAILDGASMALKNYKTIELPSLPRLADFVKWVEAASPAFGWEPGSFLSLFNKNQKQSIKLQLESSPIAMALIKLCKKEKHIKATPT